MCVSSVLIDYPSVIPNTCDFIFQPDYYAVQRYVTIVWSQISVKVVCNDLFSFTSIRHMIINHLDLYLTGKIFRRGMIPENIESLMRKLTFWHSNPQTPPIFFLIKRSTNVQDYGIIDLFYVP